MNNGSPAVFHDPRFPLHNRDEFVVAETHGIAQWATHRLLADSTGLGWYDIYTSFATESSWNAALPGLPHPCLAYCHRRGAAVDRRVDGERAEHAELRARRFGMIPADRSSTWNLEGDPEVQLVYLRRSMVDAMIEIEFQRDPATVELIPHIGFADALLEQLVIALLDAAQPSVGCADRLYVDQLTQLIAMQMLRAHSNLAGHAGGRTPDAVLDAGERVVARVRELIDESLADSDLSLASLAAAAGVGAHQLAISFTRSVGVPLHQYVIGRRVERARQLLRDTDEPLASVAYATGFSNQSHFTTTFRRIVGMTPGRYRNYLD